MTHHRWIVAFVISLVIFCNHYTRDVVGTLEKQLENDFPMTSAQYANMNSLFFGPNILSPFIAGALMKKMGHPSKILAITCGIAGIGHGLFALGYFSKSKMILFIGRGIAGTMYEIIDTFPVIVLRPLFGADSWSTVIGLVNSSLRLGSVVCFLISPFIFRLSSVSMSFLFAAFVATIGFACSIVGYVVEKTTDVDEKIDTGSDNEPSDSIENECLDLASHGDTLSSHVDFKPSPMKTRMDEQSAIVVANNSSNASSNYSRISQEDEIRDNDAGNTSIEQEEETRNKDIVTRLKELFPLYSLNSRFYFFALAAAFMYGSMVPFWFTGSKFLQLKYHLSLSQADALMLIPELEMVVFSPLLGYAMDKYNFTADTRLQYLCLSCLIMPLSYIALLHGYSNENVTYIPPWLPLICIGVGFVLSHGFIWFSIVLIFPSEMFEFCSGFVCSAINVFPTILPPFITLLYNLNHDSSIESTEDDSSWVLYGLVVAGMCASISAWLSLKQSSITTNRQHQIHTIELVEA